MAWVSLLGPEGTHKDDVACKILAVNEGMAPGATGLLTNLRDIGKSKGLNV